MRTSCAYREPNDDRQRPRSFLTSMSFSQGSTMPNLRTAITGQWHPARGLSLIELMMALTITGVLAALAWPRFEAQLQKARRSEAHAALGEVLTAQFRFRSTHKRYAGSLAELGLGIDPLHHYQLHLLDVPKSGEDGADDEPFRDGFIALAVPRKESAQAHDQACAELRLSMKGRELSRSALDKTGEPSDVCWPR